MAAKILIIDDDELFREYLAIMLSRKGYDCKTAANADEGLKLVTEFLPEEHFYLIYHI